MKKIYIKENKIELLKEFFYRDNQANADNVIVQDLDLHLWWEDDGAYPFGWFYQYDGNDKLFIGDESEMHSSPCKKALHKYINDSILEDESRAEIEGTFNDLVNGYEKYKFLEHPDDIEYREENETEEDRSDWYYEPYFNPSNYLIGKHITYNHTDNEFDDMLQSMEMSGRFWKHNNVISFWCLMSPSMLAECIKELEEQTNIDFSNYLYVYEEYGDDNESQIKYCTVAEFINSGKEIEFVPDNRENKGIHLMKPKEKHEMLKDFMNNRGEVQGNKLGNMTMAQYHNMIYQENKKNNKSLLKEYYSCPDSIYVDGKVIRYDDYNIYPFIVVDGELFIGDEGTTHTDVGLQYVINYFNFDGFSDYIERRDAKVIQFKANINKGINDDTIKCGRYWQKQNILSIWHPENLKEGELEYIVQELKEHFDINEMDLGFVYEGDIVPYTDFVQYQKGEYEENNKESEMRNIHLMNQQDKRDALKDFRNNRSEIQGKKLGKMPMAQYHSLIYQESKDIDTILENFELEVEPDEVDLSSFEIEKSLNREIWDENNKLNSKIRLKLLDIADDFFNSLEVNFVKPIDIVLTGSLCNFNWSEFSDIDLHIIVNFDEISEKTEFVKEYFDAKKNEWNNEHKDLKIYDFPIELYVQNSNEYGISNGMYSLERNKWIKEPDINDLEPLNKVSSEKIKRIASNIMTKIDDYFDYFAECSDNHKLELLNNEIDNLLYKLKIYRQKGLEKYGESGTPNIVYKVLRRTKYLEDLWDLRTQIYDKLNSIN